MTTTAGRVSRKQETWSSRFGFLMAAVGSSVGLGNIWRFTYMTGENGGGAFVVAADIYDSVFTSAYMSPSVDPTRRVAVHDS